MRVLSWAPNSAPRLSRGIGKVMINHPRRSRRKAGVSADPIVILSENDPTDYPKLLTAVEETRAISGTPFTTDADGNALFDLFLDKLPEGRQHHNCSTCRNFFRTYGGLVTIDADGRTGSALWSGLRAPEFYRPAIMAVQTAVQKSRVTGPFLSNKPVWGTPETGAWTHLSAHVGTHKTFSHAILSPGQAIAAKREDFRTVATALAEFSAAHLREALRLLRSESLQRSEHFIAPVQWLLDLNEKRAATKDSKQRDNLLWLAVSKAPDGYCHPRASVVGSLLEDLAAGMSFDDVKSRFDAKMHPLAYQRPQAAPSSGTIQQAEKMFEQMGLAPALERRFARLDEIETIWKPRQPKAKPAGLGVFSHVKAKDQTQAAPPLDIPAIRMTWVKFTQTVLDQAEQLRLDAPAHGNFVAMLAAVNADAPPILKWDQPDKRNTVSWYVYNGGSSAANWGLTPGWQTVTGIAMKPPMWGDKPQPHLANDVILLLQGAVDSRTGQGNALFPDCLRAELHGVRSVIEAYSKSALIHGRENASACGFSFPKGVIGTKIRALSDGVWTDYFIDRWD